MSSANRQPDEIVVVDENNKALDVEQGLENLKAKLEKESVGMNKKRLRRPITMVVIAAILMAISAMGVLIFLDLKTRQIER